MDSRENIENANKRGSGKCVNVKNRKWRTDNMENRMWRTVNVRTGDYGQQIEHGELGECGEQRMWRTERM